MCRPFAGSSNGRTPDSGSGSRGSSPCPAALTPRGSATCDRAHSGELRLPSPPFSFFSPLSLPPLLLYLPPPPLFMQHLRNRAWRDVSSEITLRALIRDARLVGTIASYASEGATEVTYWIDRTCWGQGIATQALRLLLEEISVRPIRARAASDNAGSYASFGRRASTRSVRTWPLPPDGPPRSRDHPRAALNIYTGTCIDRGGWHRARGLYVSLRRHRFFAWSTGCTASPWFRWCSSSASDGDRHARNLRDRDPTGCRRSF